MTVPELGFQRMAVLGLGKLGACLAATFATRGFHVIGVDVDPDKVSALARGRAPIEEPGLQETMDLARGRLRATLEVSQAVAESEAAFFVPPTPSQPDGSFSNHYVLQALRAVAEAVRDQKKQRYVFVVNSTVTPGSCDHVFRPLLEEVLQGQCGRDFGLCYNPEFIALGDVVRGLLEPDFVLIGESDPVSGHLLEQAYQRLCTNTPPIERMSNINAELAKITVNCAVTMKISFANQLGAICAKIPGADPHVILQAVGRDRRIGSHYFKPGLGYGGPCFPRDNQLFQYTARLVGVEAPLAEATDRINEKVNQRLLQTVLAHAPLRQPVAVLGLAYKPYTSVIECSPGVWLCQQLAARGFRVLAHDYAATAGASGVLNEGAVQVCTEPGELFREGCRTFAITCPWPAYRELFRSPGTLPAGSVIIDPWRMLGELVPALANISYVSSLI